MLFVNKILFTTCQATFKDMKISHKIATMAIQYRGCVGLYHTLLEKAPGYP